MQGPDQSFQAYAREYVLRLVWTYRRLIEENKELWSKLGEPER
ncbi:MAG: hypothetical protein ACR2H9_16065 [Longimicrobiaceae bacterium]